MRSDRSDKTSYQYFDSRKYIAFQTARYKQRQSYPEKQMKARKYFFVVVIGVSIK